MTKSFFSALQRALALIAAVLNDPEVREYLASLGFPMDWLSQGNSMVEGVKAADAERDVRRVHRKGLREAVTQQWRNVRSEIAALRFIALRVFDARPELLVALSLKPRKVPDPAEETSSPPAPADEKKRHQRPKDPLGAWVAKSRALLSGILADEAAVGLLAPYGYGREQLGTLLERLGGLEAKDVEHKDAAARVSAATLETRDRGRAFRIWFMPWRKTLTKALVARPELKERLGLPKQ